MNLLEYTLQEGISSANKNIDVYADQVKVRVIENLKDASPQSFVIESISPERATRLRKLRAQIFGN